VNSAQTANLNTGFFERLAQLQKRTLFKYSTSFLSFITNFLFYKNLYEAKLSFKVELKTLTLYQLYRFLKV